jgi:hypothetical protein
VVATCLRKRKEVKRGRVMTSRCARTCFVSWEWAGGLVQAMLGIKHDAFDDDDLRMIYLDKGSIQSPH